MRTALECYLHATRCEAHSRATSNDIDRQMLLSAAELWRKLGNSADDHAAKLARSFTASPP